MLFKGEELCGYQSAGVVSCCPLQSEAIVMLRGLNFVLAMGIKDCVFLTDSQVLAKACQTTHPPMAEWMMSGKSSTASIIQEAKTLWLTIWRKGRVGNPELGLHRVYLPSLFITVAGDEWGLG